MLVCLLTCGSWVPENLWNPESKTIAKCNCCKLSAYIDVGTCERISIQIEEIFWRSRVVWVLDRLHEYSCVGDENGHVCASISYHSPPISQRHKLRVCLLFYSSWECCVLLHDQYLVQRKLLSGLIGNNKYKAPQCFLRNKYWSIAISKWIIKRLPLYALVCCLVCWDHSFWSNYLPVDWALLRTAHLLLGIVFYFPLWSYLPNQMVVLLITSCL